MQTTIKELPGGKWGIEKIRDSLDEAREAELANGRITQDDAVRIFDWLTSRGIRPNCIRCGGQNVMALSGKFVYPFVAVRTELVSPREGFATKTFVECYCTFCAFTELYSLAAMGLGDIADRKQKLEPLDPVEAALARWDAT